MGSLRACSFVVLMVLVILLSGCEGRASGKVVAGDQKGMAPIRIGILSSITGTGSYHGQQELRGLELAKDVLNEKNGIEGRKIQLIVEDTKTDQATAVTSLSKLADVDGIKFIVGDSWSTTTQAIIPSANQKGILLISPIAPQDSMSEDDLFFPHHSHSERYDGSSSELCPREAQSKYVGIITSQTQFGKEHADDFEAAFKRIGGIITGREELSPTELDASSALVKIKEGESRHHPRLP